MKYRRTELSLVKRTPKLLCAMSLGALILDFSRLITVVDDATRLKELKLSTEQIMTTRTSRCALNWLNRTTKPDWDLSEPDMQNRIIFQILNQELSKGAIKNFILKVCFSFSAHLSVVGH